MKLRLLVTPDCNRACPRCCNRLYDLTALPVCTELTGYDEILLTGGEPMLYPDRIFDITDRARAQGSAAPIYLYTAWTNADDLIDVAHQVDGITLTLHSPKDVSSFLELNRELLRNPLLSDCLSLRLNVFDDVPLNLSDFPLWQGKEMTWVDDCPLPANEEFKRW